MRIAVAGATGLVGSQLVAAAKADGHAVVEIARSKGVDIASPDDLDAALRGVEAVVDATNHLGYATAADFFTLAGTNLGDAATRAGVARTVVLSIIGVDDVPEHPYYVAKVAHERAHREHSPGVRILRAAQFHEFPAYLIDRGRDGDTTVVTDAPSQPVGSAEVARVMLEMATGEREGAMVEIAGPREERIADLARKVVARRGQRLGVVAQDPPGSIARGVLLPGPDAVITGPTFDAWLEDQPVA